MTYAGMVKRSKSHFENCNNGPEKTAVLGDCSYILTPRGPNVKKLLTANRLPDFQNYVTIAPFVCLYNWFSHFLNCCFIGFGDL